MLPYHKVEIAIDIKDRSYNLLRWIGDPSNQDFVDLLPDHRCATEADVAFEWISKNYTRIPTNALPELDQLRAFSNFFESYFTCSFDLIGNPGQHRTCPCVLCAYLDDKSHIQPKKITKLDKRRALEKCVSRVEMLALEEGLTIHPTDAETLVEEHRRLTAFSAYGLSLLERVKGVEVGGEILALWRMLAWKPEGSPIKEFRLTVKDISSAEQEIVNLLKDR